MSHAVLIKSRLYFFSCFVVLLVSACYSISGHDWQRIGQVVISFFSAIVLLSQLEAAPFPFLPSHNLRRLAFPIFVLALFSALRAHQPEWAFVELALLLASCCIASAFAIERKAHGLDVDRLLIFFVVILCAVKSAQFLAGAVAAFASGLPTLNTDLLLEGFSNKRFYGQFQTFTLPLLALPLLLPSLKRSTKLWIFALLACWWMIAISGGTRGTWLGIGAAAAITMFCGTAGRRWLGWQLAAIVTGLLLFWGLFRILPDYLGIEVVNFAGDRLTTSLSARDVIWHQAWDMIKERPLLGFGPMHFADIRNTVAAHPHQAILQWACEWGIPSTLLVCWLVFRGLWATLKLIRKNSQSGEPVDLLRICLFASLIGALTQSMVDGVIVMPYSQLWLSITVGWLMAIHEHATEPQPMARTMHRLWLAALILAVGLLGYVMVRDIPHLQERERQYQQIYGGNFQPRFWLQGVIVEPLYGLPEAAAAASFSAETPK